ncbi:hypothetical protein SAMN04487949_1002 [Halogranum gelatinilyticum]|uniref:Uncharacterized protein n=1 Tax=Halogranum gelatinilyticum TaxID=660521 RepID=A0A1G9QTL4_9EURY|nr:hypothetical protein [Halogranum gelatinilyticum]SDM13907.1 hypothetical protein SAMN04487949_1002 [Halogranum gelatinilyticum]
MADPTTVKRALHGLAYGKYADTGEAAGAIDHRRVIAAATASLTAVADAASFCEHHGVDDLRTAVRVAAAHGDDDLASRGREAANELAAYRRAAAGVDTAATPPADDAHDHFHHARGTTLPGAGQRGDR